VKPGPEEPAEEPVKELGLGQQEARTCPVCDTKFYATAGRVLLAELKIDPEELRRLDKAETERYFAIAP